MTESNDNGQNQNKPEQKKHTDSVLNPAGIALVTILGNFAAFGAALSLFNKIKTYNVVIGILLCINIVLGILAEKKSMRGTAFFLCAILWGLLLGTCLSIM